MLDLKTGPAAVATARVLRRAGAAERVCVAGAPDARLAAVAADVGPGLRHAMGWNGSDVLREVLLSRGGCPVGRDRLA